MKSVETNINEPVQRLIQAHFAAARARVPKVCQDHFLSLGAVSRRHWRQRQDIPRDLAAMPRAGWQLVRKVLGKPTVQAAAISGKEQEVLQLIQDELLQLDGLAEILQAYIHQELCLAGIEISQLSTILAPENQPVIESWLRERLGMHGVALEGMRESMMFVALGVAGKTLSDKVVFGSGMGLGAAAAGSVYLHHQGWWGAFWTQVYGVPGWVSAAGAAGGFAATLVAMPLLAPLVEVGVNRFRAERMLVKMINGVEYDMMHNTPELAGVAGRIATFIGFIPDLLQLLAKLRR